VTETIAILEDDGTRIAAMESALANVLPTVPVSFFDNAQQMIDWLQRHLPEVILISLDHDLPLRGPAGQIIDCGTGRQVADFLASIAPTCPVIVHSSNQYCAPGMFFALKDAGWPCSRVYPCDDLSWIGGAWADQIASICATATSSANIHREVGEWGDVPAVLPRGG